MSEGREKLKEVLTIGSDYYIQDEHIKSVLLKATFVDWLDEHRTTGIFLSGGIFQKIGIERVLKKVLGT